MVKCSHLECAEVDSCRFAAADNTAAVNHPRHYNMGGIEVIDAIFAWNLGFNTGNAVKYIARAEHKGKTREDLEKAIWYLQDQLKRLPVAT